VELRLSSDASLSFDPQRADTAAGRGRIMASKRATTETSDSRLERLYDYTKFHIGVYIAAAGAMITIEGSRDKSSFAAELAKHPLLLLCAIFAMALAGFAGGIIVSTCATVSSFDEVWTKDIGPGRSQWMTGARWAGLEHRAFWLSAGLFMVAALLPAWPWSF
jgi:hypothetical protein